MVFGDGELLMVKEVGEQMRQDSTGAICVLRDPVCGTIR